MTIGGNLFRVETSRLHLYDNEIRQQAEKELAQLHQRHNDNVSEDIYSLMRNGGYLPTNKVQDIVPPWRTVDA